MVSEMIKDAIKKMLDDGEFGKIARWAEREGDDDAAKEVLNLETDLRKAEQFGGIGYIPIIPLVQSINDSEIWKDIVTFMMTADTNESGCIDPSQQRGLNNVTTWLSREIDELTELISNPQTTADIGLIPYHKCKRQTLITVLEKIREECYE